MKIPSYIKNLVTQLVIRGFVLSFVLLLAYFGAIDPDIIEMALRIIVSV